MTAEPNVTAGHENKPVTEADLGAMLEDVITILNESADKSQAENYTALTMEWTGALLPSLPFSRCELVFIRPGGFSPSAKAEVEKVRRNAAEVRLATAEATVLRLRGLVEEACRIADCGEYDEDVRGEIDHIRAEAAR